MDCEYYSKRLHIRTLNINDTGNVLDFHKRNRDYFEMHEEPKPKDFYTIPHQMRVLMAEAATFMDSFFIRYYFSLIDNDDIIIGTVSFKQYTDSPDPVMLIGYKIDHDMWRQGYAYEALSFLIPRIFLSGEATRLEALVNPSNAASVNLLLKLGFKHRKDDQAFCNTPQGVINHHLYFLESDISVKDMHQ